MAIQPTETDYRGILAIVWTAGTFAVLGFMLYLVRLDINSEIDNVGMIMGLLLPLNAVIINAYYGSKQQVQTVREIISAVLNNKKEEPQKPVQ